MQYWCGVVKAVCHVSHYTVHPALVTKEDTRRTITGILQKKLPWGKMFFLCLLKKNSQVHLLCGVYLKPEGFLRITIHPHLVTELISHRTVTI